MIIRSLLLWLSCLFVHITSHATSAQHKWVTVYIHGTQPGILARHSFFYRKCGLHKINSYETKHHKRSIACLLATQKGSEPLFDDTYIFGWSGKLSFAKRLEAAQQLLHALLTLRSQYADEGYDSISIRIVTHSHGGNVVLHVASLIDEHQLCIDELILLACPIVPETKDFHKHPMFKKIYAFYAKNDLFQVADKFAHAQGRYFDPAHHVIQGCIVIKKKLLWHLATHACFTTSAFLNHLPAVCTVAEQFYIQHGHDTIVTPPTIIIKKKKSNEYLIRAVAP